TALTESTKESLAVEAPSETITVITDVPDESDAGIIVSVRFVPAPSKSRFDCGTKPGFPLPALTLRRLAGVSASAIENETLMAVSSAVDWSTMLAIVGGSEVGAVSTLTAATVLVADAAEFETVTK